MASLLAPLLALESRRTIVQGYQVVLNKTPDLSKVETQLARDCQFVKPLSNSLLSAAGVT